MSLMRAMATVGGLTLISRFAGFARDVLTAGILGAGPVADAFFVALRLPNLFRRLFAEGAFAVSFVPMFSATLAERGRSAAVHFAEQAQAVMLAALLPFTIVAMAAMPAVVTALAPGFVGDAQRFPAAVEFSRITFPYLMLMSLVALMGGALNALDRFAPFAAAPIVFNATLIAGLLLAGANVAAPGYALSWAVAVSGVLQLLLVVLAGRGAGLSLRLVRPRLSPPIRKLFRLMAPGAVGAGALQLNVFIGTLLASLLPAGAVSYLYYADRLYQLPLGVVGIAIGTAMLPAMSRQMAGGAVEQAVATQNRAVEYALLLALPATAALIVIPAPIITVLFQRGAFGPDETAATAAALAAFAVGLPAYVLVKVLSNGFFSRQDTRTPVVFAIIATVVNTLLSIALIRPLGHVGIALATGIAAWINVALLARGLARDGLLRPDRRLKRRLAGQILASAGMAAAVYGGAVLLAGALAGGEGARAAALAALVAGGLLVFAVLAHVTGAAALGDLRALFRKQPA